MLSIVLHVHSTFLKIIEAFVEFGILNIFLSDDFPEVLTFCYVERSEHNAWAKQLEKDQKLN